MNTSATGLPEGFVSQGDIMQMVTYLAGTSTSGTITSGSITGTDVPAPFLQEAHWHQSVVLLEFSSHKQ